MLDKNRLHRYKIFENRYKDHILINPIIIGGVLPEKTQENLLNRGWLKCGYALCFDCIKGRSGLISKPPVRNFLGDIAEFFGGDVAEHTFGCRGAQFAVMKTVKDNLGKKEFEEHGNVVIVDPLCHYTTAITAEMAGLRLVEPPHEGYPEYRLRPEAFAEKIEDVRSKTGKLPSLIVTTHVEPYNGNLQPVKEIGEIAEDYNVPYMVNAAYTGGILPVNMREFHADFLTISAHKSMASHGPLGFLVTTNDWREKLFRFSSIQMEWSRRTFGNKILNIFGCSIGGLPLISAMYSFPYVSERVKKWSVELEKTRWLIKELEKIEGITLIGERPHRHHLLHFETPLFWEISKRDKRRGFFLAEEMLKRGIVGLQRGLSKHIKLSVYGLSWEEIKKVRDAFLEVAAMAK